MAIIFCDSCQYDTTELRDTHYHWDGIAQSAGLAVQTGGRNSVRYLEITYTYRSMPYLYRNLLDQYTTLTVSFGFNWHGDTSACWIWRFNDVDTVQVGLVNAGGVLQVRRGDDAILGSSSQLLKPDQWYQIEFQTTIDNSSGTAELHIDGETVVDLTSQDTQYSSNAQVNRIYLHSSCGFYCYHECDYCDLMVMDDSGSYCNDFLGYHWIQGVLPTADGYYSDFTCSTGSDHYVLVDDLPPNGDSDYNQGADNADKDTFTYPAISACGVEAAVVSPCCKLVGGGTKEIRAVARSSGTDGYGADRPVVSEEDFRYKESPIYIDPNTSSQWTYSNLNSAEFGYEYRDL